jgi:hypothetical protein
MLQPVKSHILLLASTALAMSVAWMDVRILWRKFVTSFAVGLFRVKATTAIDVYFRRHRFEVLRIAAATGSAEMIQFQSIRNRTNEKLIAESMNIDVLSGDANNAIKANPRTEPEPTARIWLNVNLFLHALGQSAQSDRHHSTPVWLKGCAGVNSFREA